MTNLLVYKNLRAIHLAIRQCHNSCIASNTSILKDKFLTVKKQTFQSCRTITIYEKYPTGLTEPSYDIDMEVVDLLQIGVRGFRDECKLWLHEMKERLIDDHKVFQHGDTDVIFRFDSEDCLKQWRSLSDKVHDGKSECSFIVNNYGKAVFSGILDKSTPKDGKMTHSGFSAIRSKKLRKSFFRQDYYNWWEFTHLELRIRGDGRKYMVILGSPGMYDVTWLDIYCYYIFTRGGPYWETYRIPFSKFFLSSKGRIQDKQEPLQRNKIDSVGIVCANLEGPFKLEIDYIGVHRDENETEKFRYEMYKIPKYIVSGD